MEHATKRVHLQPPSWKTENAKAVMSNVLRVRAQPITVPSAPYIILNIRTRVWRNAPSLTTPTLPHINARTGFQQRSRSSPF